MKRKQIIQTDGSCTVIITPDETVGATGYHYVVTACGELIESLYATSAGEALLWARNQWLEEFDLFGQYELDRADPTFDLMIGGVVKTLEV